MIYLVGQIGLILAVTALLFFGLGYWYGRHKSFIQKQPVMFEEGSVTAAAVSVLEDRIKQKDLQISLIQEQKDDLEAGLTRGRVHDDTRESSHSSEDQGDRLVAPETVPEDALETAPPATLAGDDLTQMRGIGTALQRQLNELGINSFEQIAQWGKADIEDYSAKLALKDRIRRGDWVGQAKKLKA